MLNKKLLFWLPLIIFHLAMFIFQTQYNRWFLVDSYEYMYAAQNLRMHGVWYSASMEEDIDLGQHSRRTPLYPFLLMLSSFIDSSPWFVAIWQIMASLLSIYLAILLLGELGFDTGRRGPLLACLLVLPAQYLYANLVMTEILFQLLMGWGVLESIRAVKNQEVSNWAKVAGILVLTMLTKPVMYLFFVPFFLGLAWLAFRWKKWVLLAIGILPFLYVLAYQGIMYQRTGYFHYSSVQSLNLLQLTSYNLLINQKGEEEAIKITDDIYERAMTAPSYAVGYSGMQSECLEIVKDYKWAYAQYHLKGMLNFFLDPGRFDLYHLLGIQEVGASAGLSRSFSQGGYKGILNYLSKQPIGLLLFLVIVLLANLVKFIGFAGFLLLKKVPLYMRLIMAMVIGYLAFVTGPYGASRFALPVALLTLVAALIFYEEMWQRWKKRP